MLLSRERRHHEADGLVSKPRGNKRHAEFVGMTDDEIREIARNPKLPEAVRGKARTEEKARKLRNRRKRAGGDDR